VRCNGEGEIISNKCAANIYRRNTFTDCDGELVMRGGMDCLIEANRLINCRGGIRLSGSHHTVRDNVIVNSSGTGIRLLFGMTKEQGGHYQAPSHCIIENNTIINASGVGILIGDVKNKDWQEKGIQNVPPSENRFRKNMVLWPSPDLFIVNNASANILENNILRQTSNPESRKQKDETR
jgi:poly(beta-D-mannuronate) lyase